ncbi:MAG: hypothetical protein OEV08_00590 [Nitrospira sp.]|nr:hypothetical protein [Nitrospira sp.]
MAPTASTFSLLLFSGDPDIQRQVKHLFNEVPVTIAKDASSLPPNGAKRSFDAIIIESNPGSSDEALSIPSNIDLAHTLVITGSRTVLKRTSKLLQVVTRQKGEGKNGRDALSLEDYLEWKMGDFVKGMRDGSGRNLHPMLISAIERPLITRALQETKGNQIQAAELLGLNRNTLRKKIKDLHIPVKRKRAASSGEA